MKNKFMRNFGGLELVRVIAFLAFLPFPFSLLPSCQIEPPLYLPQEDVKLELPYVITDLQVVWNIDIDWQAQWYYGWDERDEEIWGKLEYPDPTYFEVRRFFQGTDLSDTHTLEEAFTLYDKSFRRQYNYGYYDILVWSNIDSKDGTQVLTVDEKDVDNVIASTTRSFGASGKSRVADLKNQPEIFYSGYESDFYVPRDNFESYYDYFDEKENAWIKKINLTLDPMVYIYLVQVIIHNNNGQIVGLADNGTLTGMAESVNINTGRTSQNEADVVFGLRMKRDLPIADENRADILGGMFTTFGLCDIAPWRESRAETKYFGSRTDLANEMRLYLKLNNNTNKSVSYDVTNQIRRQIHGGLITIEIDADTIQSSTSGFDANLDNYGDSITHTFDI